MGASAERIALDIQASANVAEIAKARSEISALGDAATKAGNENVAAWQSAATSVNVQIGAYERLGKVIDKTNLGAVAGYRALGTTLKDNLFQLEATESEINRIDTAMVRLERSAGAASLMIGETQAAGAGGGLAFSGRRAQSAFIGLTFAAEAFTRSTDSGDGALRRVLRSVSLLSFALGPEVGMLTSVAVSAGDAMLDMWTRSEKAAKKAQEQFQSTLETLARGTLAAAAQARQYAYSGDPFAALTGRREGESALAFLGRSGGQLALEAEQARLRARVSGLDQATRGGTTATTQHKQERDSYIAQLREVNALLAEQDRRLVAIDTVTTPLFKKQQEMERFQLQQMRDAAARRDAQRLRPEEVPLTIGNLAEQERAFGITGSGRQAALGIRGFSSIDLDRQRSQEAQRVETESKSGGLAFHVRAAPIIETQFHLLQVETEKQAEEFQKYVSTRLGNTLADGLAAGITAGFKGGGIKAAFRAGSGVILAGLGGMLIDEGKVYLEKAAIMQSLVGFLFNPATAGWAAAGIGAALVGLGASLEALGGGGGRGGSAGGGYAAGGGTFTPNAAANGGGTTVIIQTVDPSSRGVINQTIYEINRSGMLNTPIVAPYGRPS